MISNKFVHVISTSSIELITKTNISVSRRMITDVYNDLPSVFGSME